MWSVLVPMKDTRQAKSRLSESAEYRRQLAIAMARDTLSAVVGSHNVVRVLVVSSWVEDFSSLTLRGVDIMVRPQLGLNAAIREGAAALRSVDSACNLAALPADLPYLQSDELAAALTDAGLYPRTVVADRSGTGTTLSTARADACLVPLYGAGSFLRHRHAGARELPVPIGSGLRRDVDVSADLRLTPDLGPHTSEVLASRETVTSVSGGV